jgi:hypothetical protein
VHCSITHFRNKATSLVHVTQYLVQFLLTVTSSMYAGHRYTAYWTLYSMTTPENTRRSWQDGVMVYRPETSTARGWVCEATGWPSATGWLHRTKAMSETEPERDGNTFSLTDRVE